MSDRRPPAPSGLPLLGNAVAFARDPFEFTLESVETVGDAFRIDLPVGDRYILAHPRYAERVLVSERDAFEKTTDFRLAFGDSVIAVDVEAWREQREVLDPFFFAREIQSFVPTMSAQVRRRAEAWEGGESIDTVAEMKGLTFDVFASTLLGLDPEAVDADLRRAADDLNGYFEPATWALPDWVPTPSRRRFESAKETLRTEIRSLLDADARAGYEAVAPDGPGDSTIRLEVGLLAAVMTAAGQSVTPGALHTVAVAHAAAGEDDPEVPVHMSVLTCLRNSSVRRVRRRRTTGTERVVGANPDENPGATEHERERVGSEQVVHEHDR